MRGKGGTALVQTVLLGITPAYAGKSIHLTVLSKRSWDHPRLCGEKAIQALCKVCHMGSPPPMRGKVGERSVSPLMGRITPAYAGKRLAGNCRKILFEDHPRLCGEKHILFIIGGDCMGITPAYAGKRCQRYYNFPVLQDHPRLCGEKGSNGCNFPVLIGSPPPMRGKANRSTIFCTLCGITPAYAGKRPHYAPLYSVMQGSPPPMRGKVSKENVPVLINGITPAYAGKSVKLLAPWSGFQDHPRLCGEKQNWLQRAPPVVGSPPPMRGKGFPYIITSTGSRITPAYAGKRWTPPFRC